MKTLYELGINHNTDKSTFHFFTIVYDLILSKYRNDNFNFLEIGILDGGSVKMWEEYFKNANIHAIDIIDRSYLDNDRIKTYILNQESVDDLNKLPNKFKIIIDDGGHTMFQQQITLKTLFGEKLEKGGIFILEDLHTSEPAYYNTYGSNENNNTLNLLEDLKNGKLRKESNYFIDKEEFNSLLSQILHIDIIKIKDDSITIINS